MGMVLGCREFDRLWNERLDDRAARPAAPGRAARMAANAAGCESCRCRAAVYAQLESSFGAAATLPPPASAAAVERWLVAASAAPTGAPRRGLVRAAWRLAAAAAVAAGVMVGTQGMLPLLFPIEPAPRARADQSASLLFEEAFGEATTMTLDLAREVSAPAARIGSEALGWHADRPAATLTSNDRPPGGALAGPARDSAEAGRVELISGSARHAFRFLIGTTADSSPEPDQAQGY